MTKFLIKRLASLVLVIIGITLIVFIATHCLPADPARAAAGPSATAEQERKEKRIGAGQAYI